MNFKTLVYFESPINAPKVVKSLSLENVPINNKGELYKTELSYQDIISGLNRFMAHEHFIVSEIKFIKD